MATILVAYARLSFSILSVADLAYQLLNLTGAIAVAIEAGTKHEHQPVVLNSIWAPAAIIAIIRLPR